MAIKFLNNIDLVNNELQNFKVDNVTADPTGLAGEGQMIYRTDTNQLKYHSGSNTWVTLGDAAAAGTVTSITLAADSGTGTAITDSGTFTFTGGANITTSVSGTTLTINTSATTNVGTVTSVSVVPGGLVLTGSSTVTPTLGMDYLGDTGVNNFIMEATSATPVGTDYILFNDSSAGGFDGTVSRALISDFPGFGADGTVTSISTVDTGMGLTVTTTDATSTPVITLAGTLNAVHGGTGQTSYTVGDILYASSTTALSKLGIGSDGEVLKVASGVPSWAADTNTGLTSVGITETGTALTITNSPLTANGDINIAGAGSSSQVILGDLSLATISSINGVTSIGITPGTGLDVSGSPVTSSGNIGITLDLNELTTVNVVDPAADFLVGVRTGTPAINVKTLYSNVHLDQWGDAEADVDFGANKLLDVATGTLGTDGVNLAQVQAIAAGVGVFQGGYNANTNTPALTGASNVALVQGDFYVVTTGGTFFTETVEVGDLIFANGTIAASSSPALSAYTVVIADQNIAGSGTTDGGTQKGVAGFDSANFSVTANGWVQITDVTLGSETSGDYTASVAASTAIGLLGIDVSGATGEGQAAVVGVDINGQTALTCAGAVANGDELLIYDTNTSTNKKVSVSDLSAGIAGANTAAFTITASSGVAHNFGTRDVIVQLYDLTTYETVYAVIDRVTINAVDITFSATPTNSIRVLITKVI